MPVLAISTETSQQECQYRKNILHVRGGEEEAGALISPASQSRIQTFLVTTIKLLTQLTT